MSSNNVGHLITKTIKTLQHFATLDHTSSSYTSLHLSALHFRSFTLHYPLIWLNPLTFPIVLLHLTLLKETQHSFRLQIYYYYFYYYFFSLILSTVHFTLLCSSYLQLTSLHFTFLHFLLFIAFTSPHFVITFLTLVLKMCVLPWEVCIAPSGSLFQSVIDLFTEKYFPMSVLCFLALIFQ